MALITQITANCAMNKTFKNDGTKVSSANMAYGKYQVLTINSVEELITTFSNLAYNQAYVLGTPSNGLFNGDIVASKSIFRQYDGFITRSKNDFQLIGDCFLVFDYDGGSGENGFEVKSKENYVEVLRVIDPELIDCEIGVVDGSSNGILIDGELRSNDSSYHAWIKVTNVTDENVEKYKKFLINEAWKKGFGHIKVSKSGSILQRQVFDAAVFSAERIMYESKPNLDINVTKETTLAYIASGGARDLRAITENDKEGFKIFEHQKAKMKDEANKVKKNYIETKAKELSVSTNIDIQIATNILEKKVENGEVNANDQLYSQEIGIIKVLDVFSNPNNYNNLSILDPLEPQDNTYNAMLYVNDGINMIIHSFKHGDKNYKLIPNKEVITQLCENVYNQGLEENKKFVKKIKSFCEKANIDNIERKEFATILKQKKIITRIDALVSHLMKVKFPDIIKNDSGITVQNTMTNLEALINHLNIELKYDEILKKAVINIPDLQIDTNNEMNTKLAWIKSEGVKVGLPERCVDEYLGALIDLASENPLLDMITSKEWDGKDRIQELVDCIITEDDKDYVYEVNKRWLIQCVAAWDYARNFPIDGVMPRFEQVLTFVGDQGKNKTKFFESLLPKCYRKYMIAGHHLDTHNKDSIKIAVSAGITELGELDSTFKKDIASLKAFLSLSVDILRLPYAKVESSFKRQTSFCASVNSDAFLVDETGNRRYLPIKILQILFDMLLKINKQQLFAQAYHEYISGTRWWIDPELDIKIQEYLLKKHKKHIILNAEDDIIEKVIQDTKEALNTYQLSPSLAFKTATEITTHFKLDTKKRGVISKIKEELIKAGIEYKHPNFRVMLK